MGKNLPPEIPKNLAPVLVEDVKITSDGEKTHIIINGYDVSEYTSKLYFYHDTSLENQKIGLYCDGLNSSKVKSKLVKVDENGKRA